MDLRQLEMFMTVAETGSFSAAGRRLFVSQSAVSRQIGLLESELSEPLFRRFRRKNTLTPAGEMLLRYSRRIFQDLKNASLEISDIHQLRRGRVCIVTGMTSSIYFLPPILERIKKQYPQLELLVTSGPTETLLSKIRDNTADLGLFTLPVEGDDLEVIPLVTDEMVVVTSPNHSPLSRKKSIQAKELGAYPMILYGPGSYTRRLIDRFFSQVGIEPRIAMELESIAMIKPLVRINLGISILPHIAVAASARNGLLHYLHIRDYPLTRRTGLVMQKTEVRRRVVTELVRFFTDRAADIPQSRVG